jgi:signal transduction histidine kinase
MRYLPKRTIPAIILVAVLSLILVVLAVLQYRWSGQISEAEQERMHTSLLASMNQFRLQLNNEFQRLGFLFQPDPIILRNKDWKTYAANCDIAFNGVDYDLVRNIYLWIRDNAGGSRLLRFNRDLKDFEIAPWPAGVNQLKIRYGRLFANPVLSVPEIRPFIWTIFPRIPLMIRTLVVSQPSNNPSGTNAQFIGCIMIELSQESMRENLLPDLAKKYFAGPDGFIYNVAVLSGSDPESVLYQSDPNMTLAAYARPDARIGLMDNPRERFGSMSRRPERNMERPQRANLAPPFLQLPPEPPVPRERPGIGPVLFEGEGVGYTLVAKHRKGSLEAAVTEMRWRNLALSFGSMLLLSLSMALLIVFARRAQRLARLQIDFVAGISHELRTPLAVICSAGDNLAEGVTGDSSYSTRKYGELIRSEGRKLTSMIEQILQFASARRGRRHLNLQLESINEIVQVALRQTQPMIEEAGFSVEKSLASGLPRVHVDAAALSRTIQNLIQNALKYSGDGRWLAIRTFQTEAKRGVEVRLIIEDKGMGIESEDLPHIFEPFYRGSAPAAAQIHGTGLGLFIVRETLVSMGGSIDVISSPGKGSAFTIHLPALPTTSQMTSLATHKGDSNHAV